MQQAVPSFLSFRKEAPAELQISMKLYKLKYYLDIEATYSLSTSFFKNLIVVCFVFLNGKRRSVLEDVKPLELKGQILWSMVLPKSYLKSTFPKVMVEKDVAASAGKNGKSKICLRATDSCCLIENNSKPATATLCTQRDTTCKLMHSRA